MSHYAGYLISAYGLVVLTLGLQWYLPWRRFRRFLQDQADE